MSVNPDELMAQLDQMVAQKVQEKLDEAGLSIPTGVQSAHQPLPIGQIEIEDIADFIDQVGFEKILEAVDPADSDVSLAMYAWLTRYARLDRVATLEGGGYLFTYSEPKGSSKEGYVAGGTQGDRLVDSALAKAEEGNGGAGPTEKGMCKHCFGFLEKPVGGKPYTDDDPTHTVCPQNNGNSHEFG